MTSLKSLVVLDIESAVSQRYSSASRAAEPALCCSVQFDPKYLAVLPPELIERDYGCGDPSRYVRDAETVLDLGSGAGKVCYIASQIVGPRGRVIGVDMNDDMLSLARQHREDIGNRIGWSNVEFRKGRIQDLALDLEVLDRRLREQPVQSVGDWLAIQRHADQLRRSDPMIADGSIDVVLSNCVLNLVQPRDRQDLFAELFRVLRPGGRAVISDIVSSAPVPEELRNDHELWSGCISGAFEEPAFLRAFEDAGLLNVQIVARQSEPWTVVAGIEFRSVTVVAYKPVTSAGNEPSEVVYLGPWKSVVHDSGVELKRGERVTLDPQIVANLKSEPFANQLAIRNEDILGQNARKSQCCGQNGCE